jgi:hypothetical protein
MYENLWARLAAAASEQELTELQTAIRNGGYSAFHQLLEGCRQHLRVIRDEELQKIRHLLDTAKRLFPDPGLFSPSWLHIWQELEQMVAIKSNLMKTVPLKEREGEWQVILDNPFTIEEIVCHPGLTFDEASYLFSYFRLGLEKNEYIRLQKIQNMMVDVGS